MKFNLIFPLLLLTVVSFSQPVITNESLTDPTLNIVYIGVNNEILVAGPGLPKTDSLVAINGKLIRKTASNFILQPSMADSCFLYYYHKDSIAFIKKFASHPVPMPAAKLGDTDIGTFRATVKQILDNPVVSIILPGCYLKHSFIPVRYRFRIINEGTHYKYEIINYSARLTKEQIDLLSLCIANTEVIVDEVVITDKTRKKSKAATQMILTK